MEEEESKLRTENLKDIKIKELNTGIQYCEKAIDRLNDYVNKQC